MKTATTKEITAETPPWWLFRRVFLECVPEKEKARVVRMIRYEDAGISVDLNTLGIDDVSNLQPLWQFWICPNDFLEADTVGDLLEIARRCTPIMTARRE